MQIPQDKNDSRTASLLCQFAFWFGLAGATPLFIAIHNQEDIVLPVAAVALGSLVTCIALSLAGWKLAGWAGSRLQWWINRILLVLAFAAAIQGNIVHDLFYYGAFNGETVDFRAPGMLFWTEWWGFVSFIVIGFILLTRLKHIPAWLPAIPVVSFAALVVPALLTAGSRAPVASAQESIDPAIFSFSSEANLIHLLPDGFQSDVVQEVFELNPTLAEKFAGFTLFSDHVGLYQGTAPALYTLLTGEPYALVNGFSHKKATLLIQEKAYQNQLLEQGFRLDYVPISPYICLDGAASCNSRPFNDMKARGLFRHHNEDRIYSIRLIADLTLFRLSPKFLKEKIYADGQWFFSDTTLDGSSPWPAPVLREWTENLTVTSDHPVYKWYHFVGTHIPAKWDADCRLQRSPEHERENYLDQAYCVLNDIATFLDRLRDAGIYDQTAIVISGDHGHNIFPRDLASPPLNKGLFPGLLGSGRPSFLVKQMATREPLQISNRPTSLVDVAPTALALVGLDASRPSAFDLDEKQSRERQFTPYSIPDLWSDEAVPYVEYRVSQPAWEGENWELSDIRNFKTPPDGYEPVNLTTAKGFVLGTSFDRSDPDKESSWIGGRQLGFVINIPASFARPVLELSLHLPEWIPEQSFTVKINDVGLPGNWQLGPSDAFWQTISVPLDNSLLEPGRNFLAVLFDRTYAHPKKPEGQAAALLKSIRISEQAKASGADFPRQ